MRIIPPPSSQRQMFGRSASQSSGGCDSSPNVASNAMYECTHGATRRSTSLKASPPKNGALPSASSKGAQSSSPGCSPASSHELARSGIIGFIVPSDPRLAGSRCDGGRQSVAAVSGKRLGSAAMTSALSVYQTPL